MVAKRSDDGKTGQQGRQRPVMAKFPGKLQVLLGPDLESTTLADYKRVYDR